MIVLCVCCFCFFFFKQKTAYEIYQCDWSSDVCSSDLTKNNIPNQVIGARFHQTLLSALLDVIHRLAKMYDFSHVLLSGGVMQNRLLSQQLALALEDSKYKVLIGGKVPVNDGGISFGQAVVAAAYSIACHH